MALALLVALLAALSPGPTSAEKAIILESGGEIAFGVSADSFTLLGAGPAETGGALWTDAPELTVDGVALVQRIRALELGHVASAPGESCLHLLSAGRVMSGMYWIRPAGFAGAAERVFCEQTRFGGGWTHIASYDVAFFASIPAPDANRLEHVYGTDALNVQELHGGFPENLQNARLSRGFLNALGRASWEVSGAPALLVDLDGRGGCSPGGTFIQQKLTNATLPGGNEWTVHEALVNPYLWSGATTGAEPDLFIGNVGVDYIIARDPTWDAASQRVVGGSFYGTPISGWDMLDPVTFPGNESYVGRAGRHGGFLGDVSGPCIWSVVANPASIVWTGFADETRTGPQRATVMLK